jgi:ribonuclease HI
MENSIIIYTDGSCHTQIKTGAWASIILLNDEKKTLSGIEQNTTHNRMEIQACLESIHYVLEKTALFSEIQIYTDSQYVVGLPDRKNKLKMAGFQTKKGNSLQNQDLIEKFISLLEKYPIKLLKVKAHQKKSEIENLNIEVDKMVRKLLRESVGK